MAKLTEWYQWRRASASNEELRKAGVNATLKILPVGHGAIQFDALKDAEVFFDATLKKR